jgi:predicted Zn-dependent protease
MEWQCAEAGQEETMTKNQNIFFQPFVQFFLALLCCHSLYATEDPHAMRFQQFQAEGIKLLQARDYANALKSFAAATKEHSDSWQTWLNIGVCHLRTGDYNATVSDVQKSIKLGGMHSEQCITMSGAYEGLGDPHKALAWLDLACKTNPKQSDNPFILAKMKALKDPMGSPSGKLDAPDYLAGLVSVQKWHVADFPIKVFVRKNVQLPEFYDQFDQMVRDALNQWCRATDNIVKYKFVEDKETANLLFDYTERREQVSREHDPNLEGTADNRTRMKDLSIDWSNITVLVKDVPGAAAFKKPYQIKKLLLHEIGHALGLHGHSPNPEDVMFPAATPATFTTLSKRDVNTIRVVYDLPPADPQIQGLIHVRAKNFGKALECFNVALKEHPNSWQILQNIGGCKMELGQTDQAIEYFEKSVRLGGLHHVSQCMSLAFAYQKAEKNSKVWEWLQTACWMDPATLANPEIQATIRKLEYAIGHPSGSPDAPDYLAGIFKVDKWKMDSMPLKAYVKPNPKLSGLHKEFTELVRNAMDQWCKATNGIVSYKFVDKEEGANLLWIYTDSEDDCNTVCELGLAGSTDLKVHAIDEKPELATIVVLVKDKPIAPIRGRQLLATICLHEMGHALGMNGHSPNNHDVMYPSSSIYDKAAPVLSERDKNTIRKLYQTLK